MNVDRIAKDFARAQRAFQVVELHPTVKGGLTVKAALQTSAGRAYVIQLCFPNYPTQMPQVYVTAPTITSAPHMYQGGTICYMHPSMWNPGLHDIEFVIARAAKWLNKYDVWTQKGSWPGAQMEH